MLTVHVSLLRDWACVTSLHVFDSDSGKGERKVKYRYRWYSIPWFRYENPTSIQAVMITCRLGISPVHTDNLHRTIILHRDISICGGSQRHQRAVTLSIIHHWLMVRDAGREKSGTLGQNDGITTPSRESYSPIPILSQPFIMLSRSFPILTRGIHHYSLYAVRGFSGAATKMK